MTQIEPNYANRPRQSFTIYRGKQKFTPGEEIKQKDEI
jgi:hypothetical protein